MSVKHNENVRPRVEIVDGFSKTETDVVSERANAGIAKIEEKSMNRKNISKMRWVVTGRTIVTGGNENKRDLKIKTGIGARKPDS